jgi:hypothetical protein
MRTLVAFRNEASPLLLIGIWALLDAVTIGVIRLLPGNPFYADTGMGSLGQALLFSALLVLFVALGSRLAWYLAIFSATVGLALPIVVLLMGVQIKPIIVAVLSAAALWLIWSGSIETYVKTGHRSRTPQLH